MQRNNKTSYFASELFPAYTEVTTHALMSRVLELLKLIFHQESNNPLHWLILVSENIC
jgi:hypothetical protein